MNSGYSLRDGFRGLKSYRRGDLVNKQRRIETDEQYFNALKWLVEKAQLLDHPLFEGPKRDKLIKQYEFVSQAIEDYKIRWYAERDPELREIYEELGLLPKQEPESDWLGD